MSFYNNLKPLLILCSCFAITPHYNKKTRKFKSNKIHSSSFIAIILCIIALEKTCFTAFEELNQYRPFFFFKIFIDIISNFIIFYMIFTSCFVHGDKYQILGETFDKIDAVLMNAHKLKPKHGFNIKFIVVTTSILVSSTGMLCFLWVNYPHSGRAQLFYTLGGLYFYLTVELLYFILTYLLDRIQLLRKAIEQLELYDRVNADGVIGLVNVNGYICQAVRLINAIFGWVFLAVVMEFIFNALMTIYFVHVTNFQQIFAYNVTLVLHNSCVAGLIAILANTCEQITETTEECKLIVYRLVAKFIHKPVCGILMIFSAQISKERTCISAAGFFTVNYAMLFMILNLLITYTLVLLQFISMP